MVLAHKYAPKAVYGIIRSHDGFYMDDNAEQEAFWSEKGIVGAGMESSTLLTIDRQRGMETLSILNNVVLYEGDLFYVISQPIGWFMWGHDDATKRFSPQARRWVFAGVVVAYFIGWYVIGLFHGQLPCFDSFNLVVSFIAQLLYILKYQENWSLWIWVNTANIIYWIILAIRFQMGVHIGTFGGDLSQIALQAALLFNSIYATKVWASGEADNEGGTTD